MSIWMWILLYCVICYGVAGSLSWMWGIADGDSMDAAVGKFCLYGAPLIIPGLIISWVIALSCYTFEGIRDRIWGE